MNKTIMLAPIFSMMYGSCFAAINMQMVDPTTGNPVTSGWTFNGADNAVSSIYYSNTISGKNLMAFTKDSTGERYCFYCGSSSSNTCSVSSSKYQFSTSGMYMDSNSGNINKYLSCKSDGTWTIAFDLKACYLASSSVTNGLCLRNAACQNSGCTSGCLGSTPIANTTACTTTITHCENDTYKSGNTCVSCTASTGRTSYAASPNSSGMTSCYITAPGSDTAGNFNIFTDVVSPNTSTSCFYS